MPKYTRVLSLHLHRKCFTASQHVMMIAILRYIILSYFFILCLRYILFAKILTCLRRGGLTGCGLLVKVMMILF